MSPTPRAVRWGALVLNLACERPTGPWYADTGGGCLLRFDLTSAGLYRATLRHRDSEAEVVGRACTSMGAAATNLHRTVKGLAASLGRRGARVPG